MANEVTTAEPNSQETPTDSNAPTDTSSSNTEQTKPDSQPTDDDAPKGDDPKAGDEGDDDPLAGGDDGIADDPNKKGDDDGGENAELFGVPEGEYEIALPEGMTLDAEALEAFSPTARKFNLSNEGLSALASEAYPVVEQQVQKAMVGTVLAQRQAWETDSRAMVNGGKLASGEDAAVDPAYGGETFDNVKLVAAKAIDRFAGDAKFPGAKEDGSEGTFRDFLKATGLGNHPAMVRFAYLAGKAISEDNDFERHGDVPKTKLSREEKYYGNSKT